MVVDKLSKYIEFMSLSHPYTTMIVATSFMENVYNCAGSHVLVLCKGLSRAEAAWELAENLALRFPQFSHEDKGFVASH